MSWIYRRIIQQNVHTNWRYYYKCYTATKMVYRWTFQHIPYFSEIQIQTSTQPCAFIMINKHRTTFSYTLFQIQNQQLILFRRLLQIHIFKYTEQLIDYINTTTWTSPCASTYSHVLSLKTSTMPCAYFPYFFKFKLLNTQNSWSTNSFYKHQQDRVD